MKRLWLVLLLSLLLVSSVYATNRTEAVQAIEQSKEIRDQLQSEGYPVSYINDTITEAEKALQRADLAERSGLRAVHLRKSR